jgi:hypothetical protein
MANDAQDAALSYTANFSVTAIVLLVHCLKNQGALGDRQYEDALRATIEAAGAPTERLDYLQLAVLLDALEKQVPGEPPKLDMLH